jgi:hypothetical protein
MLGGDDEGGLGGLDWLVLEQPERPPSRVRTAAPRHRLSVATMAGWRIFAEVCCADLTVCCFVFMVVMTNSA